MIQKHKLETQKSYKYRSKANKWIQDNQNKGCIYFKGIVSQLQQIYKLLIEKKFRDIKQKYDVDYQGYLELKCNHSTSPTWNFNLCFPPFEINIQSCMGKETCKDILMRIQHFDAPANKFSWSKPKTYISPKIFVNKGNFQNKVDDYTTVTGQNVTLEDGSLYTGYMYFFGDRIHSTYQPQRLKQFPILQTKQHPLISCSMISATLKDEKGKDLYAKCPFKLIEEVPKMIDNLTAKQFKKFVFDPIDGAWVQKPGLSFNEGKRTFEYEVDTIDSLGSSYIMNLIQRLNNLRETQPIQGNTTITINAILQQQEQYQEDNNDDKETNFPPCLRSNYVSPSDRQLRKLYVFPQRLRHIEISGKRFYFVPKQYQQHLIDNQVKNLQKLLQLSIKNSQEYYRYLQLIEFTKKARRTCSQKIMKHNQENKLKAERAGGLIINLHHFTFTRQDIYSNTSITSYKFKDLDGWRNNQYSSKKKVAIISDYQRKKIEIRNQIEESISKKISNYFDETTAQQKLFEMLNLQTVYLSEGQYQNQLIKFLGKQKSPIDDKVREFVQKNERLRLLQHLFVMSEMGQKQDQFSCQNMQFEDLSVCRSRIYEKIYTKKLKAQLTKDVQLNTEKQLLQMEKFIQEIKACISYMQQVRGLRGKGGLDFQVLLKQLSSIATQYSAAIRKNAELSLKNIKLLPQSSSSSAIDNNPATANSFTQKKAMLQNRTMFLKQFFNKKTKINSKDDQYLQYLSKPQKIPFAHIKIQIKKQHDQINKQANSLINQAVLEIINSRVNKDKTQIKRRLEEAFNSSFLAQMMKRYKLSPGMIQPHRSSYQESSESKLGSNQFGKQCEQYLKKQLVQNFKISLEESEKKNIQRLKETVDKIKKQFINGNRYRISQSEHIWNYCPEFNDLENKYRSLLQVYHNIDCKSALLSMIYQWEPPKKPQLFSKYYGPRTQLIKLNVSPLYGYYLNKFLDNSMGKPLQQIIRVIQQQIKLINIDIKESQGQIARQDDQIKLQQQKLLKNQWLQKLIEERKNLQIYGSDIECELQPLKIQNLRELEADEKSKVKQYFQSSILPSLEGGDVTQNCLNKIKDIRTQIENDKQKYSKAIVDRTFHQDKIKELKKQIQPLQAWIDKSKKLKQKYDSLKTRYCSLYSQKQYRLKHEISFVPEVLAQNSKLKYLVEQMKSYNDEVFLHLKSTQQIDTRLLEIDFNKMKINNNSQQIQIIYKEMSDQIIVWKNLIARRGRNPADLEKAVNQIKNLVSRLDPLQLCSVESSRAHFNSQINSFKEQIGLIKPQRQLNRNQIAKFKQKLQLFKMKFYDLKNINEMIGAPRSQSQGIASS